jgi:hypothetical protein
MNFIRKYPWQLLSAVLALVAIIVPVGIYYLGKPNKSLQILVSQPISLIDVRPEAPQDIQVLYKGEPIKNLYLLPVRIANSGNQPIEETDYKQPLIFTLSPDYRLIDVTIASSDPDNIGMTITKTSEQNAQASTTLLNQGDSMSASFFIIGENKEALLENFSISGRIFGVREIKPVLSTDQIITTSVYGGNITLIAGLLSIIIALTGVITNIFKYQAKKAEIEFLNKIPKK